MSADTIERCVGCGNTRRPEQAPINHAVDCDNLTVVRVGSRDEYYAVEVNGDVDPHFRSRLG